MFQLTSTIVRVLLVKTEEVASTESTATPATALEATRGRAAQVNTANKILRSEVFATLI